MNVLAHPSARQRASSFATALARWGWPGYVLLGFLLTALFAPLIAPYSGIDFNEGPVLSGPSLQHPFGTDDFGRDLFSRVILGSRSLAAVAGLATLCVLVVGVTWGLLAAYLGGIRDEALMRTGDVLLAIPELLTAMVIVAIFGSSTTTLVIAVVIAMSPTVSRVTRSAALPVIRSAFVDMSRLAGESRRYILFREILPVVAAVVAVEAAVRFGLVILLVASLGFLGLGVQPPTPDWGLMINESRPYMGNAIWLVLFPSLALALVIVSCHVTADRLTETRSGPTSSWRQRFTTRRERRREDDEERGAKLASS